jgi:phosphatidylinositol alpha-1,6-mannosyltransferase
VIQSGAAEAPAKIGRGRILLLSQLYPPDVGGSAVLLFEGYSRVDGAELIVAADAGSHTSGLTDAGTRLVALPIKTSRWGFVDPRAVAHHVSLGLRVRRLASRGTVVHCARALPEGIAALVARQLGGPRYVCWTHGEDLTTSLLSREQTLVTRRVHAGASAVIANSENTRRLLRESGVPDSKIHVVYPGVDPDRFSPSVDGRALRQRFAPEGGPFLLSVGRLQRRKGHDLAIAAVARLARERPHLRYVIVGAGDERARLDGIVRSLGVERHVVFAGEVPADELPAFYSACDVFLLPNRIEESDIEGFGIVFLEAAATERPVIAGNTGGVPEAVADGLTGLLVSGTDADELAAALRRVVSDNVLSRRLGRAGRARVLREFTWQSTAARIAAVHDTVLAAD